MILLSAPEQHWVCPFCTSAVVTRTPETVMHHCPGKAGFYMPMVLDGLDCKVETHEREDYLGTEMVRTDGNDRPIMTTTITRDEGEDCFVYVPTATL